MGTDFTWRFPMIGKYGAYRRAVILYEKSEIRLSYKKIMENFDIHAIKDYFDHNYKKSKFLL